MEPQIDQEERNKQFLEAMVQLSTREQKAVQGLLEGKSQTQAMVEAGYSQSMAHKQQKKVFGRDRIQSALVAAMESIGVDVEKLAGVIRDGLGANRLVFYKATGEPISIPDHAIRHKFLQTSLELRGDFPDEEIHHVTETYEEKIMRIRGRRKQVDQ
ncbi:hypothetical protein N9903_01805 [bacterium]|nr:hypothetical protein [bacterium]